MLQEPITCGNNLWSETRTRERSVVSLRTISTSDCTSETGKFLTSDCKNLTQNLDLDLLLSTMAPHMRRHQAPTGVELMVVMVVMMMMVMMMVMVMCMMMMMMVTTMVMMMMMMTSPWLETSSWWQAGTEKQLPLS